MILFKGAMIAIIGLVVLFFGIGLMLPSTVHVERAITVEAPQATLFALTNSFARFNEWSPWAARDPEARYSFTGPPRGVGAGMSWQSDHPNVGSGSQEIISSTPFEEVRTALDFGEQGTAEAFFHFVPKGETVTVTWGFDTDFGVNLVGRWFGLFFDSMLGPDYEAGLSRLKTLAEGLPGDDWSDIELSVVEMEPVLIASTRGRCPHVMEEIGPALARAYSKVGAFMKRHRLEKAAMPLVVNHEWRNEYVFEAGIPITAEPEVGPAGGAEVGISRTPGGFMVKAVHVGPYGRMGTTYSKLKAYAAAYGLELSEPAWEQYVSDPGDTPEEELITHIYYPLK